MSVNLGDLVKSLGVAFDSKDYDSCYKLLPAIKVELIKQNILIPNLQTAKVNEAYVNDLNITKKILELGALTSIFTLNFDDFEKHFAQLRPFYFSGIDILSKSENKSKLVSLYLLILLSRGDVTRFHSELEYLDNQITNFEDDDLLSYPIKVDRWLMEGSYQKAWDLLETGLKVPEFDVFSKTLMNAIRDEIAHSTELAYSELPLSNIKALLFFTTEKETESFAIEKGWKIQSGIVYFKEISDEATDEMTDSVESSQTKLIERTLDYAINLESIV